MIVSKYSALKSVSIIIGLFSVAFVATEMLNSGSKEPALKTEPKTMQEIPSLMVSEGLVAEIDPVLADTTSNEDSIHADNSMRIMERPKWRLEGVLSEHIDALQTDATNGNKEAAHILAMNLKFCYYAPLNETEFEQKIQQSYEFTDVAESINRITERFEYCHGVDMSARRQFYRFFEMAAEDGFVAALEEITRIQPQFFMDSQGYTDLERDEYINRRDAFIAKKNQHLEMASQHGSIRALMSLSRQHYAQKLGENGRIKAFAMNQLIVEFAQDSELYSKHAWYLQKQQSQLTPVEIESALAIAEQWHDIIRANGTLYLIDD